MKLEAFVRGVDGFAHLTATDKVRHLGWFLHTYKGLDRFETADINRCFDELHVHRPSNTSQVLAALARKDLIRQAKSFRLSKDLRDGFDAKYARRPETIEVDLLLSELPTRLQLLSQREYLDEALICFRHGAFRASVIMTWNVVYDHLLSVICDKHLAAFNTHAPTAGVAKPRQIGTRDDFQRWKESDVLTVANAASIVSKEVSKVLVDSLNRRNSAAHPSGSTINKLQAEAFISDIIKNAMLKIQ